MRRSYGDRHDLGACAGGVTIGIIDTGYDESHPAFKNLNPKPTVIIQPPGGKASNWHGTSVISLLAGHAESSTPGLVPNARFLIADAFFPTSDTNPKPQTDTAHLVEALRRLEERGAQIINMSLVGPSDDLVHQQIVAMSKRGIVFIAAAGNGGPSAPPAYPAAYSDEVIAVTAVNDRRQGYDYANRGSYIDVAAPGVRIWTALPDNKEGMVTGTSFAAPFVTAVAAVTYKKLNAERLRLNPKRLMLTAFLIDQIGKGERNDRFGLGLVKAPPRSTCTPQMQPVAAVVTAPVRAAAPAPARGSGEVACRC